jgi:ABC-2 type transport system ATP-binding protein
MDYEIEPAEDTDIRKEIFSRMSDRKWTILELNSNELTLEQIFLRLTDGSYENKKIIDQKEEKLSSSDKEAAFEAAFGEEEK